MRLASNEAAPAALTDTINDSSLQPIDPDVVLRIREALNEMKYGQLTISIKDGRVVQVDQIRQNRVFRRRH